MTSAARQKIDRQTLSLFDPEVEKPDHDAVVTRLFGDEAALRNLIAQHYRVGPLAAFSESDTFELRKYGSGYGVQYDVSQVPFEEAAKRTGIRPRWADSSPVRIVRKAMEVLLDYYPDSTQRVARLVGFIDLAIGYTVVRRPYLMQEGDKWEWRRDEDQRTALFEVKAQWPTQGALIRQLNLYSHSVPRFDGGSLGLRAVVGPDASVNEVVGAHGYRLIVFDETATTFTLQADQRTRPKKRGEDEF